MKKLLLLSTLGVLAFAASNLQARETVEVDINVDGQTAVREDITVHTNHVRSEGKPCTWTQGPTFVAPEVVVPAKTFQCPSCPICPKVECKAQLVEECSTCLKSAPRAHHSCKGGSCKRARHHSREVVNVVTE